ncbi:hypothetical protein DXT94_26080 [Rhizobium sp. ICMP 5592]|nr:hypothetical protein [Rhizobium sp. ICMP 5592]
MLDDRHAQPHRVDVPGRYRKSHAQNPFLRAIPGKVRSGFPSGIASKQTARTAQRFRETL